MSGCGTRRPLLGTIYPIRYIPFPPIGPWNHFFPAVASAWSSWASTLALAGRHAEALPCFDRALSVQWDDPVVLADMGYSLMALSRHAEALPLLDRALAADPKQALWWSWKCLILFTVGQTDDALRTGPLAGRGPSHPGDDSAGARHDARVAEDG